jgi:hypothetical protein
VAAVTELVADAAVTDTTLPVATEARLLGGTAAVEDVWALLPLLGPRSDVVKGSVGSRPSVKARGPLRRRDGPANSGNCGHKNIVQNDRLQNK